MTLCGWCEKRVRHFPCLHLAFRTNADGSRTEYHVRCYQYFTRIAEESQMQYNPEWQLRQAELRWEEEDRL